jgi:hypothetical protein
MKHVQIAVKLNNGNVLIIADLGTWTWQNVACLSAGFIKHGAVSLLGSCLFFGTPSLCLSVLAVVYPNSSQSLQPHTAGASFIEKNAFSLPVGCSGGQLDPIDWQQVPSSCLHLGTIDWLWEAAPFWASSWTRCPTKCWECTVTERIEVLCSSMMWAL